MTVLFIDAVGSVSTSEKLDQEELHSMVQECTGRMVAAVHRYEGTVTQFRGDGIMALFGAPIAHEDAARRGIAAAIAMRESLDSYARELRASGSTSFSYRIGLNSGPVIVGRIADDLSMDYTAIGDTVNLAARLEQWAAPGSIYVTHDTRRLAEGYFEFRDLGMLEVRGKAELVQAYAVERELVSRTRLDAAADRGLTPYVGRVQELSVLRSHFERAMSGQGQVVFISGEAGMGKSRLLLEFRRSLGDQDVSWLTGQCISYGRNIPYLPVADLLRHAFGVDEADDEATIIHRVDERAANWEGETKAAAPYLKFLLNVDPADERVRTMDPAERRAGILAALRALLVRASSQRPVVMMFEDLHWADERSEEAIAALVDVAASLRVLMMLSYRPGYAHSLGDRTYYSRVSLSNLPPGDSSALLEGVLHGGTYPEEIRLLVTEKAEGNPFYIEEVTKSLLESGVMRRANGGYRLARPLDQVSIPETIQEVILTRIDRLELEAREAIQLASVIGREFTVRLLDRISQAEVQLDGLLGQLKALELIYEKAFFPELSYMFKHALTHDVAYSTLLAERRKGLHRMVGAAIEELYADRLPEQYETLAHHYERGEQWDKAVEYLVKAAEKAIAAYANSDALAYYARALDAAQRPRQAISAARLADIGLARAAVAMLVGDMDAVLTDMDRVMRASQSAGDVTAEVRALAMLGEAQMWLHDFDAAEATLERARELAEDASNDARFSAFGVSYMLYSILSGPAAAEQYRAMAAVLSDQCTDKLALAQYWTELVIEDHWTGYYERAVQELARLRPSIESTSQAQWIIALNWAEATAVAHRGEYEKALALFRLVLELAERVGEVLFPARTLNTIGWIYGELEQHDVAMEWNQRSAVAARELGLPDPEIECNARLNVADNLIALRRLDEAEEHLAFVGRVVNEPAPPERFMLWRYSQHYCHTMGELMLLRGDLETATMLATKCLRLAEDTHTRKNIVKGLRLRGQVLAARGSLADSQREIEQALELARDIGNPGQLWKTYEALGDLRRGQGRADEADVAYRDALAVIDSMASGLRDEELRGGLLNSAAALRVRSHAARG